MWHPVRCCLALSTRPAELVLVSLPVVVDNEQLVLDFRFPFGREHASMRAQVEHFCVTFLGREPIAEKGGGEADRCVASLEAELLGLLQVEGPRPATGVASYNGFEIRRTKNR